MKNLFFVPVFAEATIWTASANSSYGTGIILPKPKEIIIDHGFCKADAGTRLYTNFKGKDNFK